LPHCHTHTKQDAEAMADPQQLLMQQRGPGLAASKIPLQCGKGHPLVENAIQRDKRVHRDGGLTHLATSDCVCHTATCLSLNTTTDHSNHYPPLLETQTEGFPSLPTTTTTPCQLRHPSCKTDTYQSTTITTCQKQATSLG